MESRESGLIKCRMNNYLDTWRLVNRDCALAKSTICRCQNLMLLASEQMQCNVVHDEVRTDGTVAKCFNPFNVQQQLANELSCLRSQLAEKGETLTKTSLELNDMQRQLLEQTAETNMMFKGLKECKLLTAKLLRCNGELKRRTDDLLEVYETRELMFTCKIIDMARELNAAESKLKFYAEASLQLDCKNKQLQSRQRTNIKKMAHGFCVRFFNIACHYMCCVWECIGCYAHSPKFDELTV